MNVQKILQQIVKKDDLNEDRIYHIDDLLKYFLVEKLSDVIYVAYVIEDELIVSFCFFTSYSEYYEGSKIIIQLSYLFNGEGPSDNLRELRHIWFNEYYFYFPFESFVVCIQWLKKYFSE